MNDPVPTTCVRCGVGYGHVRQGADVGYGLDAVRCDLVHPGDDITSHRWMSASERPGLGSSDIRSTD